MAAAVKALGAAKGKKAIDAATDKVNEQTKLIKGHDKDIRQQLNALKKNQ